MAFIAVMCGVVPFVLMPELGAGVALPVIMVPGEKLSENFLGLDFTLTNTIVGTLLADILVLAFAFGATRNLKEIPGRLQGLFEVITDALYSLAKATAGPNARKIFPLMATIFLFLLFANWLELVPGVDSIGVMHCAEQDFNGYEKNGVFLNVTEPLDPGTKATEADYHACHYGHGDDDAAGEPADAAAAAGDGDDAAAHTEPRDDLYVVTPFVRAAATDLNLTLGLGLIAFVAIQYFGTRALGAGGYFSKFINIPALNKVDKEPMGVMDFLVGLLEIISEFAKIISFGFRLFGNIFAGQIVLFVTAFLVAWVLPSIFYGLELFVGFIQAFVFAMLFMVFSAIAMQGHGHDDEHH